MNIPNNIEEVLDKKLLVPTIDLCGEAESANQEIHGDCLIKVMGIGLSCAADSPDKRITMRDALYKMESVRDALFKPDEPKRPKF